MKTKEFIRQIVNLEFRTETTHANIEIYDGNCTELATVRHDEMFGIATGLNFYGGLPLETQRKLFNLLVEYASTPVEERKEEKKYYIRFKHFTNESLIFSDISRNYLNYQTEKETWDISSNYDNCYYKTQFTLSELPNWVHVMLEQGHLVKEEVE